MATSTTEKQPAEQAWDDLQASIPDLEHVVSPEVFAVMKSIGMLMFSEGLDRGLAFSQKTLDGSRDLVNSVADLITQLRTS